MRKLFRNCQNGIRKLFDNCKGAVTVMVTLLLIPAILISGTGVDLARIYTAKSVVQDANQLAANSVLASYDALLQDLYGLFGVLGGDAETDKYVKWAIEGGGWDKGMGTFQVFYGSNVSPSAPVPVAGQNLGHSIILRRQIEEYVKLRAPAIIANLLMDKLDVFEKVQEDAKVIKKKMEVDDGVEELEKYYRKIYDHIAALENVGNRETAIMNDVSNVAGSIKTRLGSMKTIKDKYKEALDSYDKWKEIYENTSDEDEIKNAKEQMDALEKEAERLKQEYGGYWKLIQKDSKELRNRCNSYEKELKKYLSELDNLVGDCEKAEEKKADLSNKLQELKNTLNNGNCSSTLKNGLTSREAGGGGMSVLERYEALLQYDIIGMGQAMYNHDAPQIVGTLKNIQEARLAGILLTEYRQVNRDTWFPLERGTTDNFGEAQRDKTTHVPEGEYKRFEEAKPPESRNFWNELKGLYDDTKGNGAKKKKLEDSVTKIFNKAQETFKGLFGVDALEPEGAKKLSGGSNDSNPATGTKFGTEGDWSGKNKGKNELKKSLDGDFLSKLSATASEAGNKLLLLVYDTEMFSDLSTPGKDDNGYPVENMAGIPLSTDVNYYFQSELEYLYNGNLADAMDNLKSVGGMLFLVRFIFNYVASFSVRGVNDIVNAVKGALSWAGPFAILAGELTRLGLAVGESACDVARLRSGDKVAIFKRDKDWKLSISGILDIAVEGVSDSALDAAFNTGQQSNDDDNPATLSYTDYMRLFLLLVPGDSLADRTRNLIELNMTNKKNHLNANETAMASAERYDLGKANTGFEVTTTVDLRMLFLSMPLAQNGVHGVVPPRTITLTASDYRGY